MPNAPTRANEAPGRRERKKQRTHEELFFHASRLFADAGFDEITTEDIAEAADVSQRTFFRHFPSKEAVLYGDMDSLRSRLGSALEERPADEPLLIAVRHAILSLADNWEDQHDQRLLQGRLAARYPSVSAYSRAVVQAEWERELIDAIAARTHMDPQHDPRAEIIAGAAISALRSAIRRWTTSAGTLDFPKLVAESLDAVVELGALAAESGIPAPSPNQS